MLDRWWSDETYLLTSSQRANIRRVDSSDWRGRKIKEFSNLLKFTFRVLHLSHLIGLFCRFKLQLLQLGAWNCGSFIYFFGSRHSRNEVKKLWIMCKDQTEMALIFHFHSGERWFHSIWKLSKLAEECNYHKNWQLFVGRREISLLVKVSAR